MHNCKFRLIFEVETSCVKTNRMYDSVCLSLLGNLTLSPVTSRNLTRLCPGFFTPSPTRLYTQFVLKYVRSEFHIFSISNVRSGFFPHEIHICVCVCVGFSFPIHIYLLSSFCTLFSFLRYKRNSHIFKRIFYG